MDIGKPQKIVRIEPLREPVPADQPKQPARTPADPARR